jgi:hypothetical protein
MGFLPCKPNGIKCECKSGSTCGAKNTEFAAAGGVPGNYTTNKDTNTQFFPPGACEITDDSECEDMVTDSNTNARLSEMACWYDDANFEMPKVGRDDTRLYDRYYVYDRSFVEISRFEYIVTEYATALYCTNN